MKTKLQGIRMRLLLMSVIPLIIMGITITLLGTLFLRHASETECLEMLRGICISLEAACSNLNDDSYSVSPEGDLLKGDYNLTKDEEKLDKIVGDTDVEVTLFYGDVRKATTLINAKTNERIIE